ncbi:MAG: hypothetical protein Q9195_003225 [Heterodermia aff. obscurata]
MSTAQRRRGRSLHLELPHDSQIDLPSVAAVFLVLFDVRSGYTVAWKRSIPGLELTESVEFKSLPSGLHHVDEDLIYFLHDDDYAGLSAFINKPAAESERNALMLAVGVLVPLSYGRMGKSWKHAEGLKELARVLVKNPENTQPLEDFWEQHQVHDEDDPTQKDFEVTSPSFDKNKRNEGQPSPNGQPRTRNRAISTAFALAPSGQGVASHHPALSLPSFLDAFGPLIFPLYKAALLRRRILLVGHAPVELTCNYVYDISVLSGIPSSVIDLLPLEPLPTRLYPLFSVGVHDMQTLASGSHENSQEPHSSEEPGYGWVACTTDDILSMKENLYDTLVTMPPPQAAKAAERAWPRITVKRSTEIKATQRDYRRYKTLRRDLHRYPSGSRMQTPRASTEDPKSPVPAEESQETFDDNASTTDEKLIEPQSWSALAYSSFMWWASAGEQRTDLDEEMDHDSALLRDFNREYSEGYSDSPHRARPASNGKAKSPGTRGDGEAGMGMEPALIAYFHRLTSLIFRVLAEIIDSGDADSLDIHESEGEGRQETSGASRERREDEDVALLEKQEAVFVGSEDMARMGLDVWSKADRKFVEELVALYWGRKAEVQGARVECCGVRLM